MKFTKSDIDRYVRDTRRFFSACYDVFLLTVKEDCPDAEFDTFEVMGTGVTSLYYTLSDGCLGEYSFPTNWLNRSSKYIVSEHAKRNDF